MARPSYGPEAKKRSLYLFTTLLDDANDELDCDEVTRTGKLLRTTPRTGSIQARMEKPSSPEI